MYSLRLIVTSVNAKPVIGTFIFVFDNKVNKIVDGVDELGIGNFNFIIVGQSAYTFKMADYLRDPQGRVIVDANTGYPTIDPVTKQFGRTLPTDIFGASLNVPFAWKYPDKSSTNVNPM